MMLMVERAGAIPRTLADDLLISTVGPTHWPDLVVACDVAHDFLERAGAKIAHKKSLQFSTAFAVRARMKKHVWARLGQKVPSVSTARDL
eukprot:13701570-Alexandrium_andersonii.AAC.1